MERHFTFYFLVSLSTFHFLHFTFHFLLSTSLMTPERWKQVDRILQEALEREPAERATFLDQACGGDDELRCEVESLLGFHGRAGTFIEAPPSAMAAALLAEKESRAGQAIGHYEIIREIGRGGMGKVYLA